MICTEPGNLERKSVMLVKTLRAYGGAYRDCRVISYSPREGRVPSKKTLKFFRENGVETVLDPLNRQFADYGFGNKVVACADAEERFDFERLVFLDSDMFILQEPALLWSDDPAVVKVRPVERKLAGSTGADEYAGYWEKLLQWAGISRPVYVTTSLAGERIFGYWNAGVIDVGTQSGFFSHWLRNFEQLILEGLVHPVGMTFMDQIALAVTVQQQQYSIEELPAPYNFPVNKWLTPPTEGENGPLQDIVIAHYHKLFDSYPLSNPFSVPIDANEELKSLEQIISESGFVSLRMHLVNRMNVVIKSLK